MAELGAISLFMEWKLFDRIPVTGSISYAELAKSLDADESLVSESAQWCCYAPLSFRRRAPR